MISREFRTPVTLIEGLSPVHHASLMERIRLDPRFSKVVLISLLRQPVKAMLSASNGIPRGYRAGSGCLVFEGAQDLGKTLLDIHARRFRDDHLEFNRVIVETKGSREEFPVNYLLASDLRLLKIFEISSVISGLEAVDDVAATRRKKALSGLIRNFRALDCYLECEFLSFDVERLLKFGCTVLQRQGVAA